MFDFGKRLRELREQHHLSQEAMGKIIGRSKPVISSYENNLKLPTLDVLMSIAALTMFLWTIWSALKKRRWYL